jgi:hypothetical protein
MRSACLVTSAVLLPPLRSFKVHLFKTGLPRCTFRFDADNQITAIIDAGRRASTYFLPIASPKKKAAPTDRLSKIFLLPGPRAESD